VLLASNPPELVVPNDNHRDAVASRGPATDRAVTHNDTREIRVNLELNCTTITLAFGHPSFLCAIKLKRLLKNLAGILVMGAEGYSPTPIVAPARWPVSHNGSLGSVRIGKTASTRLGELLGKLLAKDERHIRNPAELKGHTTPGAFAN
jgi:hypothetical protein